MVASLLFEEKSHYISIKPALGNDELEIFKTAELELDIVEQPDKSTTVINTGEPTSYVWVNGREYLSFSVIAIATVLNGLRDLGNDAALAESPYQYV